MNEVCGQEGCGKPIHRLTGAGFGGGAWVHTGTERLTCEGSRLPAIPARTAAQPSSAILQQFQRDAAIAHAAVISHAFQRSRDEGALELMKLVAQVRALAGRCPTCGIGKDTDGDGNCAVCKGQAVVTSLPAALDALRFVRQFFVNLERGADDDPTLSALRQKYHAPVHAEIDKVLGPRP